MIDFYLYLFIAGLIGGFIAGLAGVGTGFLLIVIIPIALEHLGIPVSEVVKFTIANTIFATMCSSLMNNLTSIKKGVFYLKESLWVGGAAVICASLMLQFAIMQAPYSKTLYNIIIVIFLIFVVVRSILRLRSKAHIQEQVSKGKLITTGSAGGLVAAFTGLGGGSVVMPLLNLWLKIDIKKAKTITYATIFGTAFVLTLVNLLNEPSYYLSLSHTGYIIFPVVLPLAAGVILASPIGVIVSHRVSARTISYAFISILIIVIVRKSIELIFV